jgi:hypothetical protein
VEERVHGNVVDVSEEFLESTPDQSIEGPMRARPGSSQLSKSHKKERQGHVHVMLRISGRGRSTPRVSQARVAVIVRVFHVFVMALRTLSTASSPYRCTTSGYPGSLGWAIDALETLCATAVARRDMTGASGLPAVTALTSLFHTSAR